MGALNRGRPIRVVSIPRTVRVVPKDKLAEADRGTNGKFANDKHTAQAREHVLAASIAANSNDLEEAGRRIDSALIHTSHSQHQKAQTAMQSLAQAKQANGTGNVHDIQRNLDSAYSNLQGEPNTLLKMKKVRESNPNKPLIETLTFFPKFVEGSFDPVKRTASVIIISEGLGNRRDQHYYTSDALREAVKNGVFNGAQSYADHPSKFDDSNRPERSIRDLIGYYFDDRIVEVDGKIAIAAKMKVQEGADWALGLVKEAIDYNKKFPDKTYVGISINADGDTSPNERDGQQVNDVTSITEAFSADMVTKPARGGKFLQLVESESGSRKGESMPNKMIDAATQLEQLAEGEEIDPSVLRGLARTIREAQGDVDDTSKKGDKKTDPNADLDEAEKNLAEGKMPDFIKKKINAKKDGEDKADDPMQESADPCWDGFEMAGTKMKGGKSVPNCIPSKESASEGKGNLTESQAELKAKYPLIFAAAQASLLESGATDDLTKLRKRNAELEAAQSMRESIGLAKTKLKESSLPEGAFEDTLRLMVGRSASEMDDVIKSREAFVESLGGNLKRASGGNGGSIRLTESKSNDNTAALLVGVVED